MAAIDELLHIMARLRDPETGCAWDLQQSFASIAPYTLEEAYEVVDAIERGDTDDLRDELGDLLLQVVFHAQMAAEQGLFGFDDVAHAIGDKMLRRHPHVFGDAQHADTAALKAAWEDEKARERDARHTRLHAGAGTAGTPQVPDEAVSALDGIALALPALKRAEKLQKRAARNGFDWPSDEPIYRVIAEETQEVRAARGNEDALQDELGDLLFSVVNLVRHYRHDPEVALRRANTKFERRYREVERLADAAGLSMNRMDLAELDALWDQAKRRLEH